MILSMTSSTDCCSFNATHPSRLFRHHGHAAWPPCSLNLSPVCYCHCKYLEVLVYEVPIDSEEDFLARFVVCVLLQTTLTKTTLEIFERVAHRCTSTRGGHFEHLI
ncbi:hypothetical protein TNCT_123311 [Trichonephila clavata]|uniref:Uncharacterized protein n=1 Tax=Trichonephila clavata TaxID=2740835 RepID=A0A8X6L507_TRICU|nr:hypothetical protein TNCT_123311 [Trichonephila clavata]